MVVQFWQIVSPFTNYLSCHISLLQKFADKYSDVVFAKVDVDDAEVSMKIHWKGLDILCSQAVPVMAIKYATGDNGGEMCKRCQARENMQPVPSAGNLSGNNLSGNNLSGKTYN